MMLWVPLRQVAVAQQTACIGPCGGDICIHRQDRVHPGLSSPCCCSCSRTHQEQLLTQDEITGGLVCGKAFGACGYGEVASAEHGPRSLKPSVLASARSWNTHQSRRNVDTHHFARHAGLPAAVRPLIHSEVSVVAPLSVAPGLQPRHELPIVHEAHHFLILFAIIVLSAELQTAQTLSPTSRFLACHAAAPAAPFRCANMFRLPWRLSRRRCKPCHAVGRAVMHGAHTADWRQCVARCPLKLLKRSL